MPLASLTPVVNLPPLTANRALAIILNLGRSCDHRDAVDPGSKFTVGVVDTADQLPPVSLIPVVHLERQMASVSPRADLENINS
jgi:hypothetical protein